MAEMPTRSLLQKSLKMAGLLKKDILEFPEITDVPPKPGEETNPDSLGFAQFAVNRNRKQVEAKHHLRGTD